MAGALRFADTHTRAIIRGYAPATDLKATAANVESWGAEGVLCELGPEDQSVFINALPHPLPIVNHALAREHPQVMMVLADFGGFLETAIGHFRQLGLRSIGMLLLEEGPQVRELLLSPFLKLAGRPAESEPTLVLPTDREKLWDPHAPVKPVPAPLAKWLQALPKPVGILCPTLGGGGYLIRCCQALSLRVPEDVAVIGGDDTDLSLAGEPTLTSVVPALETLGFDAMRLLMDFVAGHRPPESIIRLRNMNLHVRESTGLRRPEICDIAAALQCISDNACRGITVAQVIRQTQRVSKVTFHRRFQELVGKSPAEAIRDRKLEEVRRLLSSTDLPLTMVSDLAGFSSSKVLARVFRIAQKTTPRDFRKHHRARAKSSSGTPRIPYLRPKKSPA
jgi:AraC-like DNA-binding protein